MAENTETPRGTLHAATRENVYRQDWATLLGTMVKRDGAKALVRYSNGSIASVTTGDRLGAGTVVAIEDGMLMLATAGGATKRLEVPGD